MVGAIVATKPEDGIPASKHAMRANWAAARTNIEALQARLPIVLLSSADHAVWIDLDSTVEQVLIVTHGLGAVPPGREVFVEPLAAATLDVSAVCLACIKSLDASSTANGISVAVKLRTASGTPGQQGGTSNRSDYDRLRGGARMQSLDRRRFNAGLFFGLSLAGCARARPDLVVTALRWSENDGATWHTGPIQAGSDVWLEADVENRGTAAAPDGMTIRVDFRVSGTPVAWSSDHTAAMVEGQTVTLRASHGPDGNRYWNNVQAGGYTVRAQVHAGDEILELDATNNALDLHVTANSASGTSQTVGAVSGGGNLLRDEAGSHKIADLVTLHCSLARVSAASPKNHYFRGNAPSPERFDKVVLALLEAGVQPYLSFVFTDDMDSSEVGIPERNYADWFAIGQAFANRFKKSSAFLASQGITDLGAYGYAAINEPDHAGGEAAGLTYTQYHDMLEGLADGVHSADPDGKVWPGGYLSHDRDGEFTAHGYCTAIIDLINDGRLEGFDLHTYHSGRNSPANFNNSHQFAVDQFIAQSGITRADINPICTETNVQADPVARQQGYTEETARTWFLTTMMDVLGTVRPDGSWVVGPRLPWNLWDQSAEQFHMAAQLVPRSERWCGHTYKMLLDLLWDMRFTFNDPRGTGVHKLKGGGKSAWVFQNIHASWSTLFGETFTIEDMPAAATKVDVYDGMGLIETVNGPGTSHVFSTPAGKSYLFVADAE